jgi:hypothetical protein
MFDSCPTGKIKKLFKNDSYYGDIHDELQNDYDENRLTREERADYEEFREKNRSFIPGNLR